jgi:hypothetical protein
MKAHFALFRIRANRAKIPPSPLLSARRVIMMYFMVVCKVSVQNTQESPPRINNSEMESAPEIMALITYKGEVPKSPKIIPSVTSMPAAETLDNWLL